MIRRYLEIALELPPEARIVIQDGAPYIRISQHLMSGMTATKIDAAFMSVQRDMERALNAVDGHYDRGHDTGVAQVLERVRALGGATLATELEEYFGSEMAEPIPAEADDA